MQVANLDEQFPGFSLSIFDIPNTVVSASLRIRSNKIISYIHIRHGMVRKPRQLVRQVRAINYTANLQDFSVVLICSLESLGDCNKIIQDVHYCDRVRENQPYVGEIDFAIRGPTANSG